MLLAIAGEMAEELQEEHVLPGRKKEGNKRVVRTGASENLSKVASIFRKVTIVAQQNPGTPREDFPFASDIDRALFVAIMFSLICNNKNQILCH